MKVIESKECKIIDWIQRGANIQIINATPSHTGDEHDNTIHLEKSDFICIQMVDEKFIPGALLHAVWKKIFHPFKNRVPEYLYQALIESEKSWLTPVSAHPKDRQFSTNMEKILRIANDMVTYLLKLRKEYVELQMPWVFRLNISYLDKVSMIFLQRLILRSKEIPIYFDTYYFLQDYEELDIGNVNQLIDVRVQDFYKSIGIENLQLSIGVRLKNNDYITKNLTLEKALKWCEGYAVLAYANQLSIQATNKEKHAEALILMMRAYLFERQLKSAKQVLQYVIESKEYSNILRARACIYISLLLANHIKMPEEALYYAKIGKNLLMVEDSEDAYREMGWLYNVEALIFYRLKELSKAVKALQQVKKYIYLVEREDAELLSSAYTQNSSYLYEAIGKQVKAIDTQHVFLKKGEGLHESILMSHWFRIGFLEGERGNIPKAEYWFEKSYEACKSLEDNYMQEWVSRSAAYLLLKAGQSNDALKWLLRSKGACERIHLIPELIGIMITIMANSSQNGDSLIELNKKMELYKKIYPKFVCDGYEQLERFKEGEIPIYQLLPKPSSRFFYPFHKFWF